MTVAVSKALEEGATDGRLRLDRQHVGVGRRLLRPGRHPAGGGAAGGRDRARKAGSGPDLRRPRDRRAGRASTTRCGWCASWSSGARSRCSTRSTRTAWRARRRPRSRCSSSSGGAPDWLALPVGNGGNITAYWKGFREIGRGAADARRPGGRRGAAGHAGARCANPHTVATAIRIGNPARLERGAGRGRRVERRRPGDRPTRASWPPTGCWPRRRACSASRPRRPPWRRCSTAVADGLVEPGSRVVCVLTGHGLKDPDTAGAGGRRDRALSARRRAARGAGVRARSRSRV